MQTCYASGGTYGEDVCTDSCGGWYGRLPQLDDYVYRYYIMGQYQDSKTKDQCKTGKANFPWSEEFFPFTPLCFKGCIDPLDQTSYTASAYLPRCTSSAQAAVVLAYDSPAPATFPALPVDTGYCTSMPSRLQEQTLYGVGIAGCIDGTDPPFEPGRHTRRNFCNITKDETAEEGWAYGEQRDGEGIFICAHAGSCVAPDICTCKDGWTGYDCKTPMCRHLQPSGAITGCENGGICTWKDDCFCIQTLSVLWRAYPESPRGITGWTGTDCSLPMCIQGFFDPFCTDLDQAPGGEGCYRCANGGYCTAPDTCTCAEGWTGYDCKTPVCEMVATPLIRYQLNTVDEELVNSFEQDPCAIEDIYGTEPFLSDIPHRQYEVTRGNCTAPNQCVCLCRNMYSIHKCIENMDTPYLDNWKMKDQQNRRCFGPWQDPIFDWRNVLAPNEMFGTRACYDGYEGAINEYDQFTSCHMNIYVPTWFELSSRWLIWTITIGLLVFNILYFYVREQLKKKWLEAKIARRRSRRNSESVRAA
uniref:EGF-like domain-containing protein n=1 Tax=Octactis speculum TaxID=3111310 RepID=A0A7S2AR06_9STRA